MKKILLILVWIGIFQSAIAQVGINTTSPNAQLDIKSSNQLTPSNTDGLLIPKIDAFPLTNPTAAQQGMMVYLTTISLGKQPGFYYWDNTGTPQWKGFGGVPDADFYEVATTNPPDAITDAMFHTGNVGIGNVSPTYKLDVEETSNLKNSVINARHTNPASSTSLIKTTVSSGTLTTGTLSSNENSIVLTNAVKGNGILNTISGAGTGLTNGVSNVFSSASSGQNGILNSFTGTPTGLSIGLHNVIEDNGNGDKMGVLDSITNGGNGKHFGIKNAFKGDGSGQRYGSYSKFEGTGDGAVWGSFNEIHRDGNGNIIGNENAIYSNGGGQHYGMQNYISGTGTGLQVGTENYIGVYNTTLDEQRGTSNYITGNTSGIQTGTYNNMQGGGSGIVYGTYNNIYGTGVGTKYGSYNYIHPSSNGLQYGVYSEALKATAYSGFFLGRFSIGTTLTNNYILPPSRGTVGQVMQTDGVGNVTWQNPTSIPNGTAVGNTMYWNGTTWVNNSGFLFNNGAAVGVNTNTPSSVLTVRQNGIGFTQEDTTGNSKIGFYTVNSGAWLQTHSNTDLKFATNNGATQMVLQVSTGNLGINTLAPGEKLEVAGKTKTTNLQITNNAATGAVLVSDATGNGTWTPPSTVASGTLDQAYDFGGAGVGRTITADAGAVTINGTDGLVSTGTFASGALMPTGSGYRMVWNPRKGAFRAGSVSGNQWDDANVGNISAAFGNDTTASAPYSTAFGNSTAATGNYSTAFGIITTASGYGSTSFGWANTATGLASTAFGLQNSALSFGETVLGLGATTYTPATNGATAFGTLNATDRILVVGNAIDINNSGNIDTAERRDALVILKNGNTGIGNSAPALARLQVQGAVGNTVAMFSGSANSQGVSLVSDWPGVYFNSYYSGGVRSMAGTGFTSIVNTDQSTGGLIFQTTNVANPATGSLVGTIPTRMTIQGNGNVGIGAGVPNGQFELSLDQGRKPGTSTWTITSDERLKTIHGDYSKGLEEILKLQPITYNYVNSGKRTFEEKVLQKEFSGFSAQAVQKIFPEAVGVDEDGFLNFNMHPILVASVNAFKELDIKNKAMQIQLEQIKIQQEEINSLKAINSEILKRLEKLENK